MLLHTLEQVTNRPDWCPERAVFNGLKEYFVHWINMAKDACKKFTPERFPIDLKFAVAYLEHQYGMEMSDLGKDGGLANTKEDWEAFDNNHEKQLAEEEDNEHSG